MSAGVKDRDRDSDPPEADGRRKAKADRPGRAPRADRLREDMGEPVAQELQAGRQAPKDRARVKVKAAGVRPGDVQVPVEDRARVKVKVALVRPEDVQVPAARRRVGPQAAHTDRARDARRASIRSRGGRGAIRAATDIAAGRSA